MNTYHEHVMLHCTIVLPQRSIVLCVAVMFASVALGPHCCVFATVDGGGGPKFGLARGGIPPSVFCGNLNKEQTGNFIEHTKRAEGPQVALRVSMLNASR